MTTKQCSSVRQLLVRMRSAWTALIELFPGSHREPSREFSTAFVRHVPEFCLMPKQLTQLHRWTLSQYASLRRLISREEPVLSCSTIGSDVGR